MNNHSVPFKISHIYEGLAESDGLLSFSNSVLKIQFQVKDSIIGIVKGKVKEIKLPISKIHKIEFIKKFWANKILITINDLQYQFDFPTKNSSEISLSIDKKNIEEAKVFVANVNYEMVNSNEQYEFEQELNKNNPNENS